jgi:uncharacterized lipoprotein YddW (UPF0748 family)
MLRTLARWLLLANIGLLANAACADPPATPYEFRAAWVATVANIDWPSRKGLSAAQLRAETDKIITQAKALGLNALILQVRPAADAIYPSSLEPWSEFLTGQQGIPPDEVNFDPLAYWVEQSHRAGLQLHAWFNPFRAWHFEASGVAAASHISKTRPDLVKRYDKYLWLDPGQADAVAHSLQVILDVARRYDIDGVHVDDYFYPYPVDGLAFPDELSWKKYRQQQKPELTLSLANWRRQNVNQFVAQLYEKVKSIKPWLRVGISPFGIGKPALRPNGIKGFSQYDSLYADVEYWLAQGWLDYLVPQLYFRLGQEAQSFDTLLRYWESQNIAGVAIWPGLFTSRVKVQAQDPWPVNEIEQQVQLVQRYGKINRLLSGQVHFSMNALMSDQSEVAAALAQLYLSPALVPPLAAKQFVPAPVFKRFGDQELMVSDLAEEVVQLLVWENTPTGWQLSVLPAINCPCALTISSGAIQVVLIGVNRTGQESEKVIIP